MSFYAGLVKGFLNSSQQEQQMNMQEGARQSDSERRLFETLMNSDDPEIKALAMTGVLSSTGMGKKKGGIRGWLGEMEQNPLLPQIQALIRTPVQTTPGSAAMPAQSMVQGPSNASLGVGVNGPPSGVGTGLPQPINPDTVAGRPQYTMPIGTEMPPESLPGRAAVAPTYRPRQVFMTPAQQANADFQTLVGGMNLSPEDRDAANRHRLGLPPARTRGQFQFERVDGTIGVATFDETGQAIDAFTKQPLPPGTSVVTPGSHRPQTEQDKAKAMLMKGRQAFPDLTDEQWTYAERIGGGDAPRPTGDPYLRQIAAQGLEIKQEIAAQNARLENDKRRAEILKDHEKKIADNQTELDNQLADLETRRAAQADKPLLKSKDTTKPVTSFDRGELLKKKADRDAEIVRETQRRIDSLYSMKSSAPPALAAGKAGKKPKDSLGIR